MTDAVLVRRVESARDLERFIAFPYELHRDDPLWVPPLRMDVRNQLSRDKNPFFNHADAQYYVAERAGRVAGRIAAVHNRAHNEFHDDRVGFFGFFECAHDQEVADRLLDTAAGWLRDRDLATMRGPASFSTNDECGVLVDGFDTPPTVLNPHNPRYYVELIESAGFQKAKDLWQYRTVSIDLPERLERAADKVANRLNVRLRSLDKKRFYQEVEQIKPLYNGAWERNWGFVPMSDAEIDHLAKQLKPIVVPDLVVFAEREGQPIGFAAAIPDMNVPLKANPSGRLFPGILKILWRARNISRLRILLLGVLKEFRGKGVAELMYHWIWKKGLTHGFDWGEAGWILEDNAPMNRGLEFMGFEVYKTLRLYDRPL